MKKNILVLGSSGQIGYHLCCYLKKENHEVLKFDILDGKKYDLRTHNNSNLANYIKKSDYVFFLAFDVGGSKYLTKYQNSSKFILNNLNIMMNTFELLPVAAVELASVISEVPLYNFNAPYESVTPLTSTEMLTSILLDVDDGVIDALSPLEAKVAEVVLAASFLIPWTTCSIVPTPVREDPSIAGKAPVNFDAAMLTILLSVIEPSTGAIVPVVGSRTKM